MAGQSYNVRFGYSIYLPMKQQKSTINLLVRIQFEPNSSLNTQGLEVMILAAG